jgi:hypothetical protein
MLFCSTWYREGRKDVSVYLLDPTSSHSDGAEKFGPGVPTRPWVGRKGRSGPRTQNIPNTSIMTRLPGLRKERFWNEWPLTSPSISGSAYLGRILVCDAMLLDVLSDEFTAQLVVFKQVENLLDKIEIHPRGVFKRWM